MLKTSCELISVKTIHVDVENKLCTTQNCDTMGIGIIELHASFTLRSLFKLYKNNS